ncbi:MAG: hypothetical protein MH204_03625 [Fimbriimonadaceae bacterium]|nr:hypothetical protein [Fimbriimonadaceae bacterium]
MSRLVKIKPGQKVDLKKVSTLPPDDADKDVSAKLLKEWQVEFDELEDLFAFAAVKGLLINVQGMDAAGKDGACRRIFGMGNILTGRAVCFKVPTATELAHDYLWRIHKEAPARGEIVIFNRSHYEDVLVVKVHELAPAKDIELRYRQINDFERMLTENGVIILKFFLHISKEEQEKRLLRREENPRASWKLAAADWREREHWDEYQDVYEEALSRCSTEWAPWHIVPSDKKWWRDHQIVEVLIEHMRELRPGMEQFLEDLGVKRRAELAEWKAANLKPRA